LSTALVAWALLTGVLHAAPIQERRGRMRWWDVALLNGSWLLSVVGTLRVIVGSGATPGGALVPLVVVAVVGTIGLCLWRWPLLTAAEDRAPPPRHGGWPFGAHVAHAGVALLGVALAAAAIYKTDTLVVLRPGETVTLDSPLGGRYTVTYFGTSRYDRENQFVTAATVELARAGRRVAVLRAERLQYEDVLRRPTHRPTARAGVLSRPREDVRVVLRGLSRRTGAAAFRLAVNPLVWWAWVGGCVLVLGGLLTAWTSFIELSRGAGERRTE
jgi:cytochrome c biogenesis factor